MALYELNGVKVRTPGPGKYWVAEDATVIGNVEIGEDCLIGANTLVGEGKVIPPRSLVLGSPGKVVREMTEKDLARIAKGPAVYRKRWREYAASLKRQPE